MKNNRGKLLAGAALLVVLAAHMRADAAQVNVAASAFHTQIGTTGGIQYGATWCNNFTGSTMTMIASLPRVPAGTAVTVFVDGFGVFGTYSCTVSSSLASRSFTVSSPTTWSRSVNFSAADIPNSAYLGITCSVPSDGGFWGVTVTG